MTNHFDYKKTPKLVSVLWLITKEGFLAAALAAVMGLLYGVFLSEEPLLRLINNSIFLMGAVLGLYALFFGVKGDKKIFKTMFVSDVKEQYLEKLSQRKERLLHLYRAFVVFAIAVILDLILFYL
jgi:glucan phosphoethanolaminetransferase (alkaline phosphatase superfamily)